jgi:hypothetical protein
LAAQQATGVVAPLTPQEGEELFALLGTMPPAKRTVERLPTQLSVHGEAHRPHGEARRRPEEAIPDEAVTLAVSLDGVLAPMQEGQRPAQRSQARATGKAPRGPAGAQEVGWATGASYDRHGERLCPRRLARMPETNTTTRKSQVTAAVMGALSRRPD